MTLNQILDKYSNGPVHFMNIDVEGAELDVLQGLALSIWRPWIILVEATSPTTEIPAFEKWESLIVSADYQFAYFDGLNRFYVAKEHSELLAAFHAPPNIFDHYVLSRQMDDQQKLEAKENVIQAQNRELEAKEGVIQAQKRELGAVIQAQNRELEAKEKVIQAQNAELKAREEIIQRFQTSYLFWISNGPFRWVPGVRLLTEFGRR